MCTKQRARLTIYWPGIDDIDNAILACKVSMRWGGLWCRGPSGCLASHSSNPPGLGNLERRKSRSRRLLPEMNGRFGFDLDIIDSLVLDGRQSRWSDSHYATQVFLV